MSRRHALAALTLAAIALAPATAASARPARVDARFGTHGVTGPLSDFPATSALRAAAGDTLIATQRGSIVRVTPRGRLRTTWGDRGRSALPILPTNFSGVTLTPWQTPYGDRGVLAYEAWLDGRNVPRWKLPLTIGTFEDAIAGGRTSSAIDLAQRLPDPRIAEPAAHHLLRVGGGDVVDVVQPSFWTSDAPVLVRRWSRSGELRYVRKLLDSHALSPLVTVRLGRPPIVSGDGALIQVEAFGRIAIARVLADGTLDPAFGQQGFAIPPRASKADGRSIAPVAFLPWKGGAVLVTPTWTTWFDAHGKVAGTQEIQAAAAGVDSIGRLLIARPRDKYRHISLLRLRADRRVDRSFGRLTLSVPGKKGRATRRRSSRSPAAASSWSARRSPMSPSSARTSPRRWPTRRWPGA